MALEAKACDGDITYSTEETVTDRLKGVFCTVNLEAKGFQAYVSYIRIIAHVNCYSTCEVICNMRSVKGGKELTADSITAAVLSLTDAIGKRFTVHINGALRFTGFLSAVECVDTKEIYKEAPMNGRRRPKSAPGGSRSVFSLEDGKLVTDSNGNSYVARLTLLSSLQRLETIWSPDSASGVRKSWIDSMKKKPAEGEKEGAGIILNPDGKSELSIKGAIASLLSLAEDVVFKPDADDLDIGDVPIAYALWPHYMNALEYLVLLTEASGSYFRINEKDRVVFGTVGLEMPIGDEVERMDATESFTFINSASAYSHGARSDFFSGDDHVGLKVTRFVEGRTDPTGLSELAYEQNRFSRYMDVAAGTTDASAKAAVRRMIGTQVRGLGGLSVEYQDNENNSALTNAVFSNWCDLKPNRLATKFGLVSFKYVVDDTMGAAQMYLKAAQLSPSVDAQKDNGAGGGGGGQSGEGKKPGPGDDRRWYYPLSPEPEGKDDKSKGAGKKDGATGPDDGSAPVDDSKLSDKKNDDFDENMKGENNDNKENENNDNKENPKENEDIVEDGNSSEKGSYEQSNGNPNPNPNANNDNNSEHISEHISEHTSKPNESKFADSNDELSQNEQDKQDKQDKQNKQNEQNGQNGQNGQNENKNNSDSNNNQEATGANQSQKESQQYRDDQSLINNQSEEQKSGNASQSYEKKMSQDENQLHEEKKSQVGEQSHNESKSQSEKQSQNSQPKDNDNGPLKMNEEEIAMQKAMLGDAEENGVNEQEKKMRIYKQNEEALRQQDEENKAQIHQEIYDEIQGKGHYVGYDAEDKAIEFDKDGNIICERPELDQGDDSIDYDPYDCQAEDKDGMGDEFGDKDED